MPACAVCGYETADAFKFCPECGAAASPASYEQRKVVTVLFSDVVDSTALGESTDPEALRGLLARYFERMRVIVERHGGTVEKFIGDAVMAVFGIPVAHEDDALRACRAALEMRAAFPDLGLQGRIGVTTGEVVTGTAERLATGDAVNVAARLQQAAQPGDALIGEPTLQLVRAAVEAELLAPLELKGKSRPVEAYRLVSVQDPSERPSEALFVGREDELASVKDAIERGLDDARCNLVTIVGEPGVGKSRLAAEALASTAAPVVQGRCLPYGEGITYWPVVEVIKQLQSLPADPSAARAIRSLLGEAEAAASAEEIAWSFRKLLEEQGPLVAVFDDIQWGEETFLDLLEHVVLLSSGTPLLLLCLARPELLERRPTWPVALRLEPLGEHHVVELIGERVGSDLRDRVVRAAGGNPLFVGEMLAMANEADGEVTVPPTLRALLSARLDQLEPSERQVLERGAVEGELFHRGAVQALAPAESQVTPRLAMLVRKELIRPDRAQLPGDDGFRFRHLLVRDAAYDGLPKSARAVLHERFATWLADRGADLVELDEILGYHLEQAHRYHLELGLASDRDGHLAKQAADRLQAAGERAAARGDMAAATNLLGRAAELLPVEDPGRLELRLNWATALTEVGELARADSILEQAVEEARAAGNPHAEWRARLGRVTAQVWMGGSQQQAAADAEQAADALAQLGDDVGLARAWNMVALTRFWLGSAATAEEAWRAASEHARRVGSKRDEAQALSWLLISGWFGPAPAEQAILRCRAALADSPPRRVEAMALLELGPLHAMRGEFTEARDFFRRGKQLLDDLGLKISAAGASEELFDIEMFAGNPAAAEAELRDACATLERLGERGFLSTRAACLAHALCAQGKHEEAEEFIDLAAETGAEDDWATQALWRSARAKISARGGELTLAIRLATEAVEIVEPTDWLRFQANTRVDLADVLELAGQASEARARLEQALAIYERKGNIVMSERVRTRLASS